MSCIANIRAHINALAADAIFATRDLVKYGKRNNVDQALFQLVHSGFILRLARGIFIKCGARIPSTLEVATYKARSFGKELVRHGQTLTQIMSDEDSQPELLFYIRGRSSTFWYGNQQIRLHGTSDRRVRGGESKIGRLIRALWYTSKTRGESALIRKIKQIPPREIRQLINQSQWMPAWLSDRLRMSC
jgi:hypothetical protein